MKPSTVYIIAVILIFSVTIVFLWQEFPIRITAEFNHEKMASYATTIGAIGAIAAMFLLRNQLVEMELARTITYKPILLPNDTSFTISNKHDPYDERYRQPWFRLSNGDIKNRPGIEIHNIGKGIARDVHIEWCYDVNEISDFFEKYNRFYDPGVTNLPLSIFERKFNFIRELDIKIIEIPVPIIYCCGAGLEIQSNDNMPKLTLSINFTDMDNVSYKKIFSVVVFFFEDILDFVFKEIP